MGNYQLEVCPGLEGLAKRAAGEWLADLREHQQLGAPYTVALCGGRAVGPVFQSVVRGSIVEPGLFRNTRFFWADERCVPPTDPESNFAEARHLLLEPLRIQTAAIHRIEGELLPSEAVNRINETARRLVPVSASGLPSFDFVLLSMGEDGHVASLFPEGGESIIESRSAYRFVQGSKPPPERITLSYAAIAAARLVLVLVSEPSKAEALRRSLDSGGKTPLAKVIAQREHTEILTAFPLPPIFF